MTKQSTKSKGSAEMPVALETPSIERYAFSLLGNLAENNNRDWYQEHKGDLESLVIWPFAYVLEAISERLVMADMPFYGGKKTMFRMHNDTRFSKGKPPYKTNVSGVLTPGGTKASSEGFVYLQMSSSGGFAAFGKYNLTANQLAPIRDRIVEESDTFASILATLKKRGLDLVRDESLKSMPRGYSEYADDVHASELKLTNMMVRKDLSVDDWASGDAIHKVACTALDCRELIEFVSVKPGDTRADR